MERSPLDAPLTGDEPHPHARRVSPEPADGYVLDPWSGLYTETEATYQHRLTHHAAAA